MPSSSTYTLSTRALLEHAGWMRQLALSLVGDVQRADDLTQETWLKALERPPRTDLPLRGWLATVMRRLLLQRLRGDNRRRTREERVALEHGSATAGSSLDVLARVAMQRELVEAVLAIDEPYRTVVLLRYFEELSPRRIAQRQGVPVSTVKTRLARGLAHLRTRLDVEHGRDGKTWAMALLPVLKKPAGLGPTLPVLNLSNVSLGALIVNFKVLVVVLLVSALGAGLFVSRGSVDDFDPSDSVASEESLTGELDAPIETEAEPEIAASKPAPSVRAAIAAPAPTRASADPVAAVTGLVVRGRVVDINGRPIGGLAVVPSSGSGAAAASLSAAEPLGRSEEDGSFTVRVEGAPSLVVSDRRYATVMAAKSIDEAKGKEVILVVAPKIEIYGRVVDEFGTPVADARVALTPGPSLRANLGWVLDYSNELSFETRTDVDGDFKLLAAPSLPSGSLRGRAEGYLQSEQPAPNRSTTDLVLVLLQPELVGDQLAGVVLTASGFPVAGARVSMGIDTTLTDELGEFAFDLNDPDAFSREVSDWLEVDATKLYAIKEGFLPGELSARGKSPEGHPIWPEHVVLRLGAEPLSIEGRVVDDAGEPLADTRVWIENPTFFGALRERGRRSPRLTHIESELSGRDPGWPFVETDSDGNFRLTGLLDREYTVVAMDSRTLMRTERSRVHAGTTRLELVVSLAESWESIRGRVVDGKGKPVADASVQLTCDAFQIRVQGQTVSTRHAGGMTVSTDSEGRFEVFDVPMERVYFRVDHPDTIPLETGRSEQALRAVVGENHANFTLVVMRRCHFRIELADASEANEFEIHDDASTVLQLSEFQGNSRRDGYRFPIIDGRTNLLAVGAAATTLVLLQDGVEVKRVALSLVSGEQQIVRP